MEEKKDKIWALKSMLQPQSEQKSCQINGPTVDDFDPWHGLVLINCQEGSNQGPVVFDLNNLIYYLWQEVFAELYKRKVLHFSRFNLEPVYKRGILTEAHLNSQCCLLQNEDSSRRFAL